MRIQTCLSCSNIIFILLIPNALTCSSKHNQGFSGRKKSSDELSVDESNISGNNNPTSDKSGESRRVVFSEEVTGGLRKEKIKPVRKIKKTQEKLEWDPTSFVNGVYKNEMSWDEPSNLVLSPVALELTFAVVCYTSGSNVAARNLMQFLRIPVKHQEFRNKLDNEPLTTRYETLQTSVQDSSVRLQTNLYIDQSFHLEFGIQDRLKSIFGADLAKVNFNKKPEEARITINEWFRSSSKVPDLLSEGSINSKTTLIMVNTILFKKMWAKPFDPKYTKRTTFQTNSEESIVELMRQKESFHIFHDKDGLYKMVELPLENKLLSFLLFLPEKGKELQDLENHLAQTKWLSDLDFFEYEDKRTSIEMMIPKFTIEYTWNFKELLTEVTMNKAYEALVNLSQLAFQSKSLDITAILQPIRVTVDERGISSEWAPDFSTDGSTTIEPLLNSQDSPLSSTSGSGSSTESFAANQPFVFAVVNREKKIILLQGHVINPSYGRASR